LARGYETQRFVMRGGDRAHAVELAQRANEREVVRRHVRYDEQTNAARRVLGNARVGGGRGGAGAEATGDVDFPRHFQAALPTLRVSGLRHELLGGRVVTRPVIEARAMDPNARKQP
jgi:hypothetical protein